MNYAQVRDESLRLIHQESIAGSTIPGTYNNQQDYIDKIPGLLRTAQIDLATTSKRIPAVTTLGALTYETMGRARVYTLPEDLWQRGGSGLLVPMQDRYYNSVSYRRFNQVRAIGRTKLIVPDNLPDETLLEYYRYPIDLGDNPDDTDELDNTPEAQVAVPYYIGAHLVITDDAFLYATLYNTYQQKKNEMTELPQTEPDSVVDVFDFDLGSY